MTVPQKPVVPGAGPRPVRSREDVLEALPALLQGEEPDPARDALVDGLTGLLFEYQFRAERGMAMADGMRSTRDLLLGIGAEHSIARAPDEPEEVFRARLFNPQEVVSEPALIAGINRILSASTPLECELVDGVLDRWFIGGAGPRVWSAFLGAPPHYPERLHSDDKLMNDGHFRPNSAVHGPRIFNRSLGRHLLIRLPDLGFLNGLGSFPGIDFFPGNGSSVLVTAFLNQDETEALAVYRAISSFVDNALGQSVRWTMIADVEAA